MNKTEVAADIRGLITARTKNPKKETGNLEILGKGKF